MLGYTEIKPGMIIVLDGQPFEIISTTGVVKKQRQKPHNTAKLKNLYTGATIEKTFTQADKIEEAELEKKEYEFVFAGRGKAVFKNPENPADRIELKEEMIEEKLPYLKGGSRVDLIFFEGDVVTIKLPIKVDLKVKEAPPNIKGNTQAGGSKYVVLETGLKVSTPLFIETGDIIRVNTETGEYVERVQKG